MIQGQSTVPICYIVIVHRYSVYVYFVSSGLFPPSLETILNSSNLATPFKTKITQHMSCDVTIQVTVPVVEDSVRVVEDSIHVVEDSVPVLEDSVPLVEDRPFTRAAVEAAAITAEAAAITAEAVVTELSTLATTPTTENTAQKLCTKKILGKRKKPTKRTGYSKQIPKTGVKQASVANRKM